MIHEGSLVLTPADCALLLRVLPDDVRDEIPVAGERDKYFELCWSLRKSAELVPIPLNGDKVWNGLVSWRPEILDNGDRHNQVRTVVRARSKAEALRLLAAVDGRGESPSRFNTHWSTTAGVKAMSIVTERGVWAEGKDGWVKLYPNPKTLLTRDCGPSQKASK